MEIICSKASTQIIIIKNQLLFLRRKWEKQKGHKIGKSEESQVPFRRVGRGQEVKTRRKSTIKQAGRNRAGRTD